jgi:hypothetical protein
MNEGEGRGKARHKIISNEQGSRCVPVDPNFLYSPRKRIEEFEESILGKIFRRNPCDEDGVRLNRF